MAAFFRRDDLDPDVLEDAGLAIDGGGGPKIRCPKCQWEPTEKSRWFCTCGCSWNTFDTAGLCPSCGKQWTQTACLRCSAWSLHKDWYVADEEED